MTPSPGKQFYLLFLQAIPLVSDPFKFSADGVHKVPKTLLVLFIPELQRNKDSARYGAFAGRYQDTVKNNRHKP